MTVSGNELDELIEQTESAEGLIDEIEEALEAVRTDETDFSSVQTLFATELSKRWSELDSKLSSQDDWQTIDKVVQDVQDFLEDLHKGVLSPRRTQLDSRFDEWLGKWSVEHKDALEPFLDNADDEDLTYLEKLIEEIEKIEINDELIQQQLTEWLSHQVKQLAQTEKRVANLKVWLKQIRDIISEAYELDGSLEDIAESIQHLDNDILQLIGKKWFSSEHQNLTDVNTEQHDPAYAARKDKVVSSWEAVSRKLRTLGVSLGSLNSGERTLVSKDIEGSSMAEAIAIDKLTDELSRLIEVREKLRETPQLQADDASLKRPEIESVGDLWNKRPNLPEPRQSENLEAHISDLRHAESRLEEWLESYDQVSDQLDEMCSTWGELAAAHDVQEAVKGIEEMNRARENLGDLARIHNSLLEITGCIRRELKRDLPEDEKAMFEVVLDRISRGEERLDVVDFEADIHQKNCIEVLGRLAKKKLVRIEVATWRGQP